MGASVPPHHDKDHITLELAPRRNSSHIEQYLCTTASLRISVTSLPVVRSTTTLSIFWKLQQ